MKGLNRVFLMGNLVRDPEVKYTNSNKARCSFSLAVNRKIKGDDGQYKDSVTYLPIVVWGAMGENCERYLKKGSAVHVEGFIDARSYEKDGQKRSITEIVATDVTFLSSNNNQQQGGYAPQGQQPQSYRPQQQYGAPAQAPQQAPFFDPRPDVSQGFGSAPQGYGYPQPQPQPAPSAAPVMENVDIPF